MLSISIHDSFCEIVVLKGKYPRLKVISVRTLPIEQGAIINGFVQNDEELVHVIQEGLSTVASSLKRHAILQINSSTTIYRKLSFPHMKKEELERNVYRMMESQMSNLEEYALDYSLLSDTKENGIEVLACAILRRMVKDYSELLRRAGVIDVKMSTPTLGLLQWMQIQQPEHLSQNCIVTWQKGQLINTILILEGKLEINNVFRVNSKQVSDALAQRTIQMMQYYRTKEEYVNIHQVYLSAEENMEQTCKDLSDLLSVSVVPLDGNGQIEYDQPGHIATYASAIGCFFLNKKDFDFTKYERFEKALVKKQGLHRYLPIVLVVNLLVVLAGFCGIYVQASHYRTMQSHLEETMQRQSFVQDYLTATNALQQATELRGIIEQKEAIQANMDQYQAVDAAFLKQLQQMADQIEFVHMNVKDYNQLSIVCVAPKRNNTYSFIEALKQSDLVNDVLYEGFTYTEQGYVFTVTFYVQKGVTK